MTQEQSGTEAETGAGLNAARAVTGVESWPDEEVWLTGRVEQRQRSTQSSAAQTAAVVEVKDCLKAGFFGYPEILDRGFGVILSLTRGMASYPREHFGLRRNLSILHSLSCQS
ncbi:unnamed protein product, partial [Pleuronectes platessa]